jgi:hypothetical protein
MLYDYSDVYSAMDHTIDFVRRFLSETPGLNLLEENSDSSGKLELEGDLAGLEFNPIEQKAPEFTALAIDGGQGTIVGNNVFVAGVYRAGYVSFRSRTRSGEFAYPLKLVNLSRANYMKIFEEAYEECYGICPEVYPAFGETLGWLRKIREDKCLTAGLSNLQAGDMILMDGALRGDDRTDNGFLKRFLKDAAEKGVNVIAVSKASGLLWRGGANLVAVIKNLGDRLHKDKCWYARVDKIDGATGNRRLGHIYIARLAGFSNLAFRIDLSRFNIGAAADVLAGLSSLATDPFFLGYPYPLAAAHQMVRLSGDELYGFALRLRDKAILSGIDEGRWDILFGDYHYILNHDVSQKRAM